MLDDRGILDGTSTSPDDDAVQASLQSALDAAFGAGTTIVRVHREPYGETRDERDVKRLPLAGDLNRTSGDERYAGPQKSYQRQTATEERGSETRDLHRIAAPDATARLSVAIFVDGSRAIDLDAIRSLAAAAAGIDARRGDELRVEAVRFAAPPPSGPRGIDAWAIAGLFAGTLPQLALVAAVVALAIAGARPAYALLVRAVESAGVREAARDIRRSSAGARTRRAGRRTAARRCGGDLGVAGRHGGGGTGTLSARGTRADRAPAGARRDRLGAASRGIAACPRLTARLFRSRGCCARSRRARAVPACDVVAPDGAPLAAVVQPAECAELARDVRLFRARLADVFEAACDAWCATSPTRCWGAN